MSFSSSSILRLALAGGLALAALDRASASSPRANAIERKRSDSTVAVTVAARAALQLARPGTATVEVFESGQAPRTARLAWWSARPGAGALFVIEGRGLWGEGSTRVLVGGRPVNLLSVSATRVAGHAPAPLAAGLAGAVVVVGSGPPPTSSNPIRQLDLSTLMGSWSTGPDMPGSLGEVACGILDGRLFMMGESNASTFVYDIAGNTWSRGVAQRPFAGNHHACEVIGGRLYLFGGLGASSQGRVQVYDRPSDQWSLRASMPWNGGSCASALIGGKVYVAGGIVGNSTVGNLSVYDPATNTWDATGPLPSMPVPVNHAASATDGRRLWVFGGRQGNNSPQPGFSVVQAFDPATGTWDASTLPGSTLAPMPLPRGGTGRAVYFFGQFYVMGGESSSQVFDDVQVYDPRTNTWRVEADMPTARHGIFPIRHENRILVAGGGTNAGFSSSRILEIYEHP